MLIKVRADDAKSANDARRAAAHVGLSGNVIEMDPLAVVCRNDSLCTQNDAVGLFLKQGFEDRIHLVLAKLLGCFNAPADKYVIGVVMMVMVAIAVGIIALVVVMMMLVTVAVGIVALVVVMMVMLVAIAVRIVALVVVMVMLVAVAVGIVALVVVMMVLVALAVGIVALVEIGRAHV